MFYFSHLGYQISRVDQLLGRIAARYDDFAIFAPALDHAQKFTYFKQVVMNGDIRLIEN